MLKRSKFSLNKEILVPNQKPNIPTPVTEMHPPFGYYFFMGVVAVVIALVIVFLVLSYFA